jgi:hypothetical protein
MGSKKLYIEYRPRQDDYAVKKGDSKTPLAATSTQKEAIDLAKKMDPGHSPDVARVKHTNKGKPDQWRKA